MGYTIERIKTGVNELDSIIEGGFVKGSSILISGGPGTGKTIFGSQFLYKGANEYNEPGILVSLDETPQEVRNGALRFGFDFAAEEKKGKIVMIDGASSRAELPSDEKYVLDKDYTLSDLANMIYKIAKETGAKRFVLDSISILAAKFKTEEQIREAINTITKITQKINVTSLYITEVPFAEHRLSRYGFEEYITRGVIQLRQEEKDRELKRSLVIWKMRETKHGMKKYPFAMASNGIQLLQQ